MLQAFIQKILLAAGAVVAAFALASCTTNDASMKPVEPSSIEASSQRKFDHVWSDEEKALIQAMYASTQYSDDIWKQVAYNLLGTGQKNNPILQHFDCEYGCYLTLDKAEMPSETRFLVQVGVLAPKYYLLETREEVENGDGSETNSLPIDTFPRKANIGKRCSDSTEVSCYQAFSDRNGSFVAMKEDHPNATYLTQQTPFDDWKPNK